MRSLLWKEWRENRLIVVWSALLVLVLMAAYIAWCIANHQPAGSWEFQPLLLFVWVITALLCGSAIMAQEIGSGTLQFLSSLPVKRPTIWCAKLLMGLGILLLGLCSSTLAYLLVCWLGIVCGVVNHSYQVSQSDVHDVVTAILYMLPLYAVGAMVTMLLDRTISALMTSIVVTAAAGAAVTGIYEAALTLFGSSRFIDEDLLRVLYALTVPIFLAISYKLFTRGETLRTSKRFRILAGYLLPPATVAAALLISWFIIMS